MSSPIIAPFTGPGTAGGMPPFPFPCTMVDSQRLTVAANRFPRDFVIPQGCRVIPWACWLPSYQGSDVISFQFNGDSSSGTYWDNTDSSAAVSASGDTTPTGTKRAAVSANLIRLGLATNKWRLGFGLIGNTPTKEKAVGAVITIGSATPPGTTNILHGATAGGWDGAAPSFEISTIQVLTAGGVKMSVDTQVWFFALM